MAHPKRTVYDLLAKENISEVTIEQLDAATSSTSVDRATVGFWKGPLTIHRVLEMRTYPWGLPIPEVGAVGNVAVDAAGFNTIQPSGSELWQITGMMGTGLLGSAVINLAWFDGSGQVIMVSQQTLTTGGTMIDINEKVSAPFILSNSLYLIIFETGASNACRIDYAYHKVSL